MKPLWFAAVQEDVVCWLTKDGEKWKSWLGWPADSSAGEAHFVMRALDLELLDIQGREELFTTKFNLYRVQK